MLDPHTHGEGLLGHVHALPEEGLQRIPGAVADAQQHRIRDDLPHLLALPHLHAHHAMPRQQQLLQPGLEQHLSAQPKNLRPHGGHHTPQKVGADVRLGEVQYLLGCAMLHKRFQHGLLMDALNARGQLAVRKRARTALAELHVAFRVQHARLRHARHVLRTRLHRLAPLDQDRLCPRPGQRQCGEQTRRARPHHHRRFLKGGLRQHHRRRRLYPCSNARLQVPQYGILILQAHVQRQHKMNIALVPRIHGLLFHLDREQFVPPDTEPVQHQLRDLLLPRVQRSSNIPQPQQTNTPNASIVS